MAEDGEPQLREIDERLLRELEQGWRTRKYLAGVLDVTGRYVKDRIDFLRAVGYVEVIHDGFYRLADDGDEDNSDPDGAPHARASGDSARDGDGDLFADWPSRRADHPDQMRAAARAALDVLRENGWMAGSDFRAELLPEFDVDGQSEDTWWRKSVRPILQRAVDADLVEYRDGYHDYGWQGDLR